jgi:hypothetical protein
MAPPWSMFATTDRTSGGFAPFLVVPAIAQSNGSPPIEEVHLLRDETADITWGIERIVEGPIGAPMPEPSAPTLVPRVGVRLQRLFCRARSAGGPTHLWIARRKQVGAGQASSGLRYDLVSDAASE